VTDQVSNPYNKKRQQEVEDDVESDKILATNCTYGNSKPGKGVLRMAERKYENRKLTICFR
jgi:hypothetical protein